MGSSNSRQLLTPQQDGFSSRFTFLRVQGATSYYIQSLTNKEYATKLHICDTPEEEQSFFASLGKMQELKHENIVSVEKVYRASTNRACGNDIPKFLLLFPYSFRSVKDERDERAVMNQSFSEPEIWSIMLSVCKALVFLQDRGISYSPVTSQNILIDREGIIEIDGNHLVENSLIEDSYISRNKNLRYIPPELKQTRLNYLNIREVQKCNVYSLGIIVLECLQKRDLIQLQNTYLDNDLQLMINRESFVSTELRQMIRKLTDSKAGRPTYKDIINYIQNEGDQSSLLFRQNQISTAKKPSYAEGNQYIINPFEERPSSNVRVDIPRSTTIPFPSTNTVSYTIPSFSYNNVTKGVNPEPEPSRVQGFPQPQYIVESHFQPRDPPQPQLFEQAQTHLNFNYLRPDPIELFPSAYRPAPMREINSNVPVVVNYPKQQYFEGETTTKFQSSGPFTLIQKNIESKVLNTDFSRHLRVRSTVADQIKQTTPKLSSFARQSVLYTQVQPHRPPFSKTGSIQGINKMYNDNPYKFYDKFDCSNLNNVGNMWLYFQGNFREGIRCGPGMLYMSNGEIFEGNFINDIAQGRGKYSTLDWKVIEGIWRDGQLVSLV